MVDPVTVGSLVARAGARRIISQKLPIVGHKSLRHNSCRPCENSSMLMDATTERRRGPRLKLAMKGRGFEITLDDSPVPTHRRMPALARSIGSDNPEFAKGILGHVVNAANGNEADANFQLAAIQGIAPRDTTESLLAAQMSAAHVATMAAARSLARAETLVQYEAYERAFNKLARTFAAQVEALKRYRSSGSQKVTVEHININDGGRAIVGTVALAPRGGQIYDEPPHAKQIAHALEPALFSPDPPRDALSVASDAEWAVPDARRQVARRS